MSDACVVTVLAYSGRPDPEWSLEVDQVARLRRAWLGLTQAAAAPRTPALGYRGVRLECASGEEWHAFGGVVTHRTASEPVELRQDDEQRFERMVLETAPRGALLSGIPGMPDLRQR